MKRYTWKMAISFTVFYALLMVVVIFAYTQISENFIMQQASNNLLNAGETISTRIEAQLSYDYDVFENLVEQMIIDGLDPVTELQNQIGTYQVNNQFYSGFGTISSRQLITQDGTYTYQFDYQAEDFDQRISLYSFNEAFLNNDDQKFIFFKVDNLVAYFDAKTYLTPLFDYLAIDAQHGIVREEGSIYYQDFRELKYIEFFNYLREENYTQNQIEDILFELVDKNRVAEVVPFLGVKSIITFTPIITSSTTLNLFIVSIYSYEDVVDSMDYLSNILWAFFVVIFVLFAGALVLLYKLLDQKMNDIENAKITHYYAKPYIVRITAKGKIKSYNRNFKKLLGDYDVYTNVSNFKIKQEFDFQDIEDVISKQKSFTAIFELGLSRQLYIRFIPMRISGGYLLVGDDITHIEGRFDEFRNLALYNKSTHLPNYNSLKMDLQQLFLDKELLARTNSLVTFDIVSFSSIHLLLGEKSADRFLVIIAELAKQSLEGYPATLYNIESDHFFVYFKDIENLNWVTRWIQKLLTVFDKPITLDRNFINVDVKVGTFHIEADKYEILNADVCYDNAMLALNHAKESSQRKEFTYDVSLGLIASRDQRMEIDLAQAIKNQEFRMALQPKYDNLSEKIIGFEALIRWNNPKYMGESPLKFIQMAEKNNMIIDIGRIALHETFQIAKEFEKYNLNISVNVSPVQLLQAGFVNDIIAIFEQYELKKGSISLEVTETFLIGSFDLVITKLKLLKKYGFGINLDDFGTGYSSLQYLRDLPIDTIKIDRAFVINIETDAFSRAIVSMISNLAKSVGLEVVAEGIETDRQNQLVYKNGCNIIQGYLLSPPVFKNDAIKLIEDYNITRVKRVETLNQPKDKGAKK